MKLKNPKSKGARQERRAKKMLESAGYYCTKAGGSLGEWDLICLGARQARLIQVKSNRPPREEERERLRLFPKFSYATKELWIFIDREQEPLIKIIK